MRLRKKQPEAENAKGEAEMVEVTLGNVWNGLTCAQGGTGQLLYGLSITRQSSIERGGVCATPGPLLEAPPTATVTR